MLSQKLGSHSQMGHTQTTAETAVAVAADMAAAASAAAHQPKHGGVTHRQTTM